MKIKQCTYSLLMLVILSLSCGYDNEEDQCNYRPSDCVTKPLDMGYVKVIINRPSMVNNIVLTLYNGTVDDGKQLIAVDSPADTSYYKVPTGFISVKAAYLVTINGSERLYNSINGEHSKSRSESYCEGECYYMDTVKIDARLNTSLLQ